MNLQGCEIIELLEHGDDQHFAVEGPSFTFGCTLKSGYILADSRALATHAEIKYNSSGQLLIYNYSKDHPVLVNDVEVTTPQPLTNRSFIKIFDHKFLWLGSDVPLTGEIQSRSLPGFGTHSDIQCNRFTINNFNYCIKSNEEGNTSPDPDIHEQSQESMLNETPKMQVINLSQSKEETRSSEKKRKILRKCKATGIALTYYSPRETGVRIESSHMAVLPVEIFNSTPKKNSTPHLIDFSTPTTAKKTLQLSLHKTSMHLIDLTSTTGANTPKPKESRLFKSALLSSAKRTAEKPRANIAPHRSTPKPAESRSRGPLFSTPSSADSVISVSSITDSSSVVEISSAELAVSTPKRTPASLMKRAVLTSARKAAVASRQNTPISNRLRFENSLQKAASTSKLSQRVGASDETPKSKRNSSVTVGRSRIPTLTARESPATTKSAVTENADPRNECSNPNQSSIPKNKSERQEEEKENKNENPVRRSVSVEPMPYSPSRITTRRLSLDGDLGIVTPQKLAHLDIESIAEEETSDSENQDLEQEEEVESKPDTAASAMSSMPTNKIEGDSCQNIPISIDSADESFGEEIKDAKEKPATEFNGNGDNDSYTEVPPSQAPEPEIDAGELPYEIEDESISNSKLGINIISETMKCLDEQKSLETTNSCEELLESSLEENLVISSDDEDNDFEIPETQAVTVPNRLEAADHQDFGAECEDFDAQGNNTNSTDMDDANEIVLPTPIRSRGLGKRSQKFATKRGTLTMPEGTSLKPPPITEESLDAAAEKTNAHLESEESEADKMLSEDSEETAGQNMQTTAKLAESEKQDERRRSAGSNQSEKNLSENSKKSLVETPACDKTSEIMPLPENAKKHKMDISKDNQSEAMDSVQPENVEDSLVETPDCENPTKTISSPDNVEKCQIDSRVNQSATIKSVDSENVEDSLVETPEIEELSETLPLSENAKDSQVYMPRENQSEAESPKHDQDFQITPSEDNKELVVHTEKQLETVCSKPDESSTAVTAAKPDIVEDSLVETPDCENPSETIPSPENVEKGRVGSKVNQSARMQSVDSENVEDSLVETPEIEELSETLPLTDNAKDSQVYMPRENQSEAESPKHDHGSQITPSEDNKELVVHTYKQLETVCSKPDESSTAVTAAKPDTVEDSLVETPDCENPSETIPSPENVEKGRVGSKVNQSARMQSVDSENVEDSLVETPEIEELSETLPLTDNAKDSQVYMPRENQSEAESPKHDHGSQITPSEDNKELVVHTYKQLETVCSKPDESSTAVTAAKPDTVEDSLVETPDCENPSETIPSPENVEKGRVGSKVNQSARMQSVDSENVEDSLVETPEIEELSETLPLTDNAKDSQVYMPRENQSEAESPKHDHDSQITPSEDNKELVDHMDKQLETVCSKPDESSAAVTEGVESVGKDDQTDNVETKLDKAFYKDKHEKSKEQGYEASQNTSSELNETNEKKQQTKETLTPLRRGRSASIDQGETLVLTPTTRRRGRSASIEQEVITPNKRLRGRTASADQREQQITETQITPARRRRRSSSIEQEEAQSAKRSVRIPKTPARRLCSDLPELLEEVDEEHTKTSQELQGVTLEEHAEQKLVASAIFKEALPETVEKNGTVALTLCENAVGSHPEKPIKDVQAETNGSHKSQETLSETPVKRGLYSSAILEQITQSDFMASVEEAISETQENYKQPEPMPLGNVVSHAEASFKNASSEVKHADKSQDALLQTSDENVYYCPGIAVKDVQSEPLVSGICQETVSETCGKDTEPEVVPLGNVMESLGETPGGNDETPHARVVDVAQDTIPQTPKENKDDSPDNAVKDTQSESLSSGNLEETVYETSEKDANAAPIGDVVESHAETSDNDAIPDVKIADVSQDVLTQTAEENGDDLPDIAVKDVQSEPLASGICQETVSGTCEKDAEPEVAPVENVMETLGESPDNDKTPYAKVVDVAQETIPQSPKGNEADSNDKAVEDTLKCESLASENCEETVNETSEKDEAAPIGDVVESHAETSDDAKTQAKVVDVSQDVLPQTAEEIEDDSPDTAGKDALSESLARENCKEPISETPEYDNEPTPTIFVKDVESHFESLSEANGSDKYQKAHSETPEKKNHTEKMLHETCNVSQARTLQQHTGLETMSSKNDLECQVDTLDEKNENYNEGAQEGESSQKTTSELNETNEKTQQTKDTHTPLRRRGRSASIDQRDTPMLTPTTRRRGRSASIDQEVITPNKRLRGRTASVGQREQEQIIATQITPARRRRRSSSVGQEEVQSAKISVRVPKTPARRLCGDLPELLEVVNEVHAEISEEQQIDEKEPLADKCKEALRETVEIDFQAEQTTSTNAIESLTPLVNVDAEEKRNSSDQLLDANSETQKKDEDCLRTEKDAKPEALVSGSCKKTLSETAENNNEPEPTRLGSGDETPAETADKNARPEIKGCHSSQDSVSETSEKNTNGEIMLDEISKHDKEVEAKPSENNEKCQNEGEQQLETMPSDGHFAETEFETAEGDAVAEVLPTEEGAFKKLSDESTEAMEHATVLKPDESNANETEIADNLKNAYQTDGASSKQHKNENNSKKAEGDEASQIGSSEHNKANENKQQTKETLTPLRRRGRSASIDQSETPVLTPTTRRRGRSASIEQEVIPPNKRLRGRTASVDQREQQQITETRITPARRRRRSSSIEQEKAQSAKKSVRIPKTPARRLCSDLPELLEEVDEMNTKISDELQGVTLEEDAEQKVLGSEGSKEALPENVDNQPQLTPCGNAIGSHPEKPVKDAEPEANDSHISQEPLCETPEEDGVHPSEGLEIREALSVPAENYKQPEPTPLGNVESQAETREETALPEVKSFDAIQDALSPTLKDNEDYRPDIDVKNEQSQSMASGTCDEVLSETSRRNGKPEAAPLGNVVESDAETSANDARPDAKTVDVSQDVLPQTPKKNKDHRPEAVVKDEQPESEVTPKKVSQSEAAHVENAVEPHAETSDNGAAPDAEAIEVVPQTPEMNEDHRPEAVVKDEQPESEVTPKKVSQSEAAHVENAVEPHAETSDNGAAPDAEAIEVVPQTPEMNEDHRPEAVVTDEQPESEVTPKKVSQSVAAHVENAVEPHAETSDDGAAPDAEAIAVVPQTPEANEDHRPEAVVTDEQPESEVTPKKVIQAEAAHVENAVEPHAETPDDGAAPDAEAIAVVPQTPEANEDHRPEAVVKDEQPESEVTPKKVSQSEAAHVENAVEPQAETSDDGAAPDAEAIEVVPQTPEANEDHRPEAVVKDEQPESEVTPKKVSQSEAAHVENAVEPQAETSDDGAAPDAEAIEVVPQTPEANEDHRPEAVVTDEQPESEVTPKKVSQSEAAHVENAVEPHAETSDDGAAPDAEAIAVVPQTPEANEDHRPEAVVKDEQPESEVTPKKVSQSEAALVENAVEPHAETSDDGAAPDAEAIEVVPQTPEANEDHRPEAVVKDEQPESEVTPKKVSQSEAAHVENAVEPHAETSDDGAAPDAEAIEVVPQTPEANEDHRPEAVVKDEQPESEVTPKKVSQSEAAHVENAVEPQAETSDDGAAPDAEAIEVVPQTPEANEDHRPEAVVKDEQPESEVTPKKVSQSEAAHVENAVEPQAETSDDGAAPDAEAIEVVPQTPEVNEDHRPEAVVKDEQPESEVTPKKVSQSVAAHVENAVEPHAETSDDGAAPDAEAIAVVPQTPEANEDHRPEAVVKDEQPESEVTPKKVSQSEAAHVENAVEPHAETSDDGAAPDAEAIEVVPQTPEMNEAHRPEAVVKDEQPESEVTPKKVIQAEAAHVENAVEPHAETSDDGAAPDAEAIAVVPQTPEANEDHRPEAVVKDEQPESEVTPKKVSQSEAALVENAVEPHAETSDDGAAPDAEAIEVVPQTPEANEDHRPEAVVKDEQPESEVTPKKVSQSEAAHVENAVEPHAETSDDGAAPDAEAIEVVSQTPEANEDHRPEAVVKDEQPESEVTPKKVIQAEAAHVENAVEPHAETSDDGAAPDAEAIEVVPQTPEANEDHRPEAVVKDEQPESEVTPKKVSQSEAAHVENAVEPHAETSDDGAAPDAEAIEVVSQTPEANEDHRPEAVVKDEQPESEVTPKKVIQAEAAHVENAVEPHAETSDDGAAPDATAIEVVPQTPVKDGDESPATAVKDEQSKSEVTPEKDGQSQAAPLGSVVESHAETPDKHAQPKTHGSEKLDDDEVNTSDTTDKDTETATLSSENPKEALSETLGSDNQPESTALGCAHSEAKTSEYSKNALSESPATNTPIILSAKNSIEPLAEIKEQSAEVEVTNRKTDVGDKISEGASHEHASARMSETDGAQGPRKNTENSVTRDDLPEAADVDQIKRESDPTDRKEDSKGHEEIHQDEDSAVLKESRKPVEKLTGRGCRTKKPKIDYVATSTPVLARRKRQESTDERAAPVEIPQIKRRAGRRGKTAIDESDINGKSTTDCDGDGHLPSETKPEPPVVRTEDNPVAEKRTKAPPGRKINAKIKQDSLNAERLTEPKQDEATAISPVAKDFADNLHDKVAGGKKRRTLTEESEQPLAESTKVGNELEPNHEPPSSKRVRKIINYREDDEPTQKVFSKRGGRKPRNATQEIAKLQSSVAESNHTAQGVPEADNNRSETTEVAPKRGRRQRNIPHQSEEMKLKTDNKAESVKPEAPKRGGRRAAKAQKEEPASLQSGYDGREANEPGTSNTQKASVSDADNDDSKTSTGTRNRSRTPRTLPDPITETKSETNSSAQTVKKEAAMRGGRNAKTDGKEKPAASHQTHESEETNDQQSNRPPIALEDESGDSNTTEVAPKRVRKPKNIKIQTEETKPEANDKVQSAEGAAPKRGGRRKLTEQTEEPAALQPDPEAKSIRAQDVLDADNADTKTAKVAPTRGRRQRKISARSEESKSETNIDEHSRMDETEDPVATTSQDAQSAKGRVTKRGGRQIRTEKTEEPAALQPKISEPEPSTSQDGKSTKGGATKRRGRRKLTEQTEEPATQQLDRGERAISEAKSNRSQSVLETENGNSKASEPAPKRGRRQRKISVHSEESKSETNDDLRIDQTEEPATEKPGAEATSSKGGVKKRGGRKAQTEKTEEPAALQADRDEQATSEASPSRSQSALEAYNDHPKAKEGAPKRGRKRANTPAQLEQPKSETISSQQDAPATKSSEPKRGVGTEHADQKEESSAPLPAKRGRKLQNKMDTQANEPSTSAAALKVRFNESTLTTTSNETEPAPRRAGRKRRT